MSSLFTATIYTGVSNEKMKSEKQGEDGDEVDIQFFSSYPHCRRHKTEVIGAPKRPNFIFSPAAKVNKGKGGQPYCSGPDTTAHTLNIIIFPSTAITNTFSCK